jgi:hypothetical protein
VSQVQGLAHRKQWNPERQSFHTGRFPLADAMDSYTIGPMSADKHKQIGFWRGARSFIKQNANFEKSKKLKADQTNFKTRNDS